MAATKARSSSSRKRSSSNKPDAYQVITERIVDALDHGVVPWHRPWRSYSDGPMSLSTRKPYSGINVFVLGASQQIAGYDQRWWGTYKQIAALGGQVRKGEKGTPIVFWRFFEPKGIDPTTGDRRNGFPVLRYFTVFNACQADDLVVPTLAPIPDADPILHCEDIIASYQNRGGPVIRHGGNKAFYRPFDDVIQLPKIGQFDTPDAYYGVAFHEAVHSTGAESRLNRKDFASGTFGSPDYSYEELVAEMGAAFVCGEAGIDVNVPNRASYIASWLRNFNDDPKMVVRAAGASQKAADLILDRNQKEEDTDGDDD